MKGGESDTKFPTSRVRHSRQNMLQYVGERIQETVMNRMSDGVW